MDLETARASVGKWVSYDDGHGDTGEGVVSSVNERVVFVRFAQGVKACSFASLTVLTGEEEPVADGLTLAELLDAVETIDAFLDSHRSPEYLDQPLANDWARVTKVCEEAGEVWKTLSKRTGENFRKGVCATEDDLLGELGDCVSGAMLGIQHRTKDTAATWAVVSAAFRKASRRIADHAEPECICAHFRDTGGLRVGDLTCPVHGVNGTEPLDGPWEPVPAILHVGGERFYCTAKGCDVGVFTKTGPDTYACNGCGRGYEAGDRR